MLEEKKEQGSSKVGEGRRATARYLAHMGQGQVRSGGAIAPKLIKQEFSVSRGAFVLASSGGRRRASAPRLSRVCDKGAGGRGAPLRLPHKPLEHWRAGGKGVRSLAQHLQLGAALRGGVARVCQCGCGTAARAAAVLHAWAWPTAQGAMPPATCPRRLCQPPHPPGSASRAAGNRSATGCQRSSSGRSASRYTRCAPA